MTNKIVIMAGGSGTRFFPLSTEAMPKQFLPLFSDKPMIVETVERVLPLVSYNDIYVSTGLKLKSLVEQNLPRIPKNNLILEPVGRNTAPALGLVCLKALHDDPDALILSLHSDHLIRNESRFLRVLQAAIVEASQYRIVTLGIEPQYPETGYGYIELGSERAVSEQGFSIFSVSSFKEKPDLETAKHYLQTKRFMWNAGMFVFRADFMLSEIKKYAPDLHCGLMELSPYIENMESDEFVSRFINLPSVSIDVAILEKSDAVSVIPCDIGWSDVGSFLSLYELADKDSDGNACIGAIFNGLNSQNNLLVQTSGSGKRIGLLGVHDLMVVDTEDFLLIGNLSQCQKVKELIPK
ncbi:MAG: mannose-1-phosphate guanylyltransferase [Candidatus Cloacimonetes bacterium]|nr:mannose-1-phosphate guanylyltransferase [Candidatus Cloacimonadota bacterium]